MYSVVRVVACANEIVKIEDPICSPLKVLDCNGIDVVNRKATEDLSIGNGEIAPVISNDSLLPKSFPIKRSVKSLVHVSVKSESVSTNSAS